MLDRKVVKIELAPEFMPDAQGERVYRVWCEDVDFDYVWAKDELQAYQRVMRNETDEQNKE